MSKPQRMLVVARQTGLVETDVPSAKDRSLVGKHHAAIGRFLDTGDEGRLQALAGKTIKSSSGQSYELETSPEEIEQLALAGDFGYEDIYLLE